MASRDGVEYRVGPLGEIPDRGGVLVRIEGKEIGVFKVQGSLHAYENRCRHQGGPVCTGEIVGRYEAILNPDRTVAGERFADDELRIACPWHGWEYNLETGACAADPRFRLRRYQVTLRGADVYVRV